MWLLTKSFIDDLVYGPIGNTGGIFFRRIMEGDSIHAAASYWHGCILGVTIMDLQFWPLWGCLNFAFVPVAYNVHFTALGGIIWQVYMSLKSHLSVDEALKSRSDDDLPLISPIVPPEAKGVGWQRVRIVDAKKVDALNLV